MIDILRPKFDWQAVERLLANLQWAKIGSGNTNELGVIADMPGKKILIADDEPTVREIIQVTLERMDADFEIVVAKDGGEALNFIMDNSYDLMITDIRMPVLNGLRLATVVRSLGEELEIIWISGYGFYDLLDEIDNLKIHSYLDKPVKVGEIRANVRAALGFSPSI